LWVCNLYRCYQQGRMRISRLGDVRLSFWMALKFIIEVRIEKIINLYGINLCLIKEQNDL
jgi:hypothetical protein